MPPRPGKRPGGPRVGLAGRPGRPGAARRPLPVTPGLGHLPAGHAAGRRPEAPRACGLASRTEAATTASGRGCGIRGGLPADGTGGHVQEGGMAGGHPGEGGAPWQERMRTSPGRRAMTLPRRGGRDGPVREARESPDIMVCLIVILSHFCMFSGDAGSRPRPSRISERLPVRAGRQGRAGVRHQPGIAACGLVPSGGSFCGFLAGMVSGTVSHLVSARQGEGSLLLVKITI
jgi:hypothetical protein